MKKLFLATLSLFVISNCFADIPIVPSNWDWWNYQSLISSNQSDVIVASSIENSRILQVWGQQWIAGEGSWISNVINSDSKTTNQATDDVVSYISAFINWALWMAFFVALVFLIYNWYLVVTAAWNDAQYKKWISYMRYMAIWLVGIALSFFIVQLIFGLIFKTVWE